MRTLVLGALAAALLIRGVPAVGQTTVLTEDFQTDPALRGWRVAGDASLFRWDADAGNLAVTWDSSRTNSYFYFPLNTTLTREDDFAFAFTVELAAINFGTTPDKPGTFEISVGFLNFGQATGPDFLRGTGSNSTNLVEWDYFPDSGFGATISSTIVSIQNQWAVSFNSPVPLDPGIAYDFKLRYEAQKHQLVTTVRSAGESVTLKTVVLDVAFDDFAVDAFAVSSYSDAGQNPGWAGSVLAHGAVDDVQLELPTPPIRRFTGHARGGAWQAEFTGWLGWRYTLKSSPDLHDWSAVGAAIAGTGQRQTLADPQPLHEHSFYRLRADPL